MRHGKLRVQSCQLHKLIGILLAYILRTQPFLMINYKFTPLHIPVRNLPLKSNDVLTGLCYILRSLESSRVKWLPALNARH